MTATEFSPVDRAYIEAYRFVIEHFEARGMSAFVGCTEELIPEALDIALDRFSDVLPGLEAAEPIALPPIVKVEPPRPRRRRFPATTLLAYPLTQPIDRCQRCGEGPSEDHPAIELDHMMELAFGGPDHPHNLIRLCWRCHRAKPLPTHLAHSFGEWRLAIIVWVLERPRLRWFDPDEMAEYRRTMRLLFADRVQ